MLLPLSLCPQRFCTRTTPTGTHVSRTSPASVGAQVIDFCSSLVRFSQEATTAAHTDDFNWGHYQILWVELVAVGLEVVTGLAHSPWRPFSVKPIMLCDWLTTRLS